MNKLYLIGCFLIALVLPHLTDSSVSAFEQGALQIYFIAIGIAGFKNI